MRTKRVRSLGLVRSDVGREGNLFKTNIILLFALFVIIFVVPVLPGQRELFTSTILCILVVSGLFAANFSRAAFRILFTIGTIVIMVTILNLLFPDIQNLNPLTFLVNTVFFILVSIALVGHVAKAREVDRSILLCAINSYLLIGVTFSLLHLILDQFIPGSLAQADPLEEGISAYFYYGFVTLTTLGYGDITPSTELARSLSIFNALFGQLYLVIIMALIIGKYLSGKKSAD